MSVPVICTEVAKTFRGSIEAVSPMTVSFAAGQTTALVGPSGCGKSTLLRMIAGLETPSAGQITIADQPPEVIRRSAGLSVAFQDPSLLPWRSVRKNIELALDLARMPKTPNQIEQLIHLVGLDGFADTRPAELSGGMRQRAAIARALSTRPKLLLLDEPFGAVDELTRKQLANDLPGIWEASGTTTLLVTHSVSEAVALSDRVIVLSARPAQVVADIDIPFARPRTPDLLYKAEFTKIMDEVYEALAKGVSGTLPKAAQ
ncbi:ABC transporter ATP-binding protein [Marivita sp. S0852]|uniref:ABC transporter ATP-binding protein n=1 Tax=Marivita sp. S0852 TaxID=3373893 RepID=UPI003981B4D6